MAATVIATARPQQQQQQHQPHPRDIYALFPMPPSHTPAPPPPIPARHPNHTIFPPPIPQRHLKHIVPPKHMKPSAVKPNSRRPGSSGRVQSQAQKQYGPPPCPPPDKPLPPLPSAGLKGGKQGTQGFHGPPPCPPPDKPLTPFPPQLPLPSQTPARPHTLPHVDTAPQPHSQPQQPPHPKQNGKGKGKVKLPAPESDRQPLISNWMQTPWLDSPSPSDTVYFADVHKRLLPRPFFTSHSSSSILSHAQGVKRKAALNRKEGKEAKKMKGLDSVDKALPRLLSAMVGGGDDGRSRGEVDVEGKGKERHSTGECVIL